MNTSLGYSKKTLTDSNVLLSGGGDKALSEFIGSLNWDSTNKKLQYKSASGTNFTDLITFGSNAFTSYSGYNIAFLNNAGTTVDTFKALTSPSKTFKAGTNVQMTAASNVITITATDTTYDTVSKTAAGLCPALPNETTTTKYLRLDGSWTVPAYPTKASWNYDDVYVKSVSISGDSLRINKNGTNADLTIPYASKAALDSNGRSLVTYKEYSWTFPPNDGTLQWYTLISYIHSHYTKSAIIEISTRRAAAMILINFFNVNTPYITFLGYFGSPTDTLGGFTGGVRVIADGEDAKILFQFYASSSTSVSYRVLSIKVYSEVPEKWVIADSLVADTATYNSFLANIKATSSCLTGGGLMPTANNTYNIGSSSSVYKHVYATIFHGALDGNASSATKLNDDNLTLWGQSFNGTANVSGNMTDVGTVSASGDYVITKTSGATKFAVVNNNGSIELLTQTSRGVYDRTNGKWLISTNGANTLMSCGNVAIASAVNTTYKLYVEGTIGATGNTTLGGTLDVTGNISADSDIYLSTNNKRIYAKDKDGTDRDVLRLSSNNVLLVGSGLNSIASTTGIFAGTKGFYICTNGTTKRMFIDSSGNVGIGTTSPSYKLSVNGDVSATNFRGSLIGNAESATKLITAKTLWGQSFDGTDNVSGDMTSVGSIDNILHFKTNGTNTKLNIEELSLSIDGTHLFVASQSANYSNSRPLILQYGYGNVGIGLTAPDYKLDVAGDVGATNFYTTSDRSKKQNISSLSEHIRKFQLKDTEKWHYGVIAQEVPKMFRCGEEGNMTVNYNSILSYYVGLLENKVKELEEKIKLLETKQR